MSCAVADDGSCGDAPAAPPTSNTAVAMVAVSNTPTIFMLINRVSADYTTCAAFDARTETCLGSEAGMAGRQQSSRKPIDQDIR